MPQLVSQWLLLQIALIISAALHAKTKMFGKQHVLMMVQLAPHHGLDAFCNHWGRCFSVQLDKEQAIRHPLAQVGCSRQSKAVSPLLLSNNFLSCKRFKDLRVGVSRGM